MRMFKQRRQNREERRLALGGIPTVRPGVRLETMADGNMCLYLSIKRGNGLFERMRPPETTRRYELDAFGSFVIGLIDGKRTVLELVDAFEARFQMSRREVELSVVAFVKLLMQRHVLAVVMPSSGRAVLQSAVFALVVLFGTVPGVLAEPDVAETGAAAPTPLGTLAAMQALYADAPTLLPGSPGNLALEAKVANIFADSGFETGEIQFAAPFFAPGELTLDVGEQGRFALAPMHPSLMRPGNFTEDSFETRLVYLGKGSHADLERLKGVDLEDALAVMVFDCGDRWLDLLRFGIRGFLFVGAGNDYSYEQSVTKVYDSEVSVPRFFIDGEAGQRLRALVATQPGVSAMAQAEPSRWSRGTLRDLWVLIPGADPDLGQKVVVFTAALDANAVVPGQAAGAQRAVNLAVLLRLLEDFRAQQPLYSVLLVAVNGHTQRYAGERQLAWHLMAPDKDVEAMRNEIAVEMRYARLHANAYGRLQLKPVSPADKQDLHILLEVLWTLDAQQREAREHAHAQAMQAHQDRIVEAMARGETIRVEDLDAPQPDEILDLSLVTQDGIAAAIEQVAEALKSEHGGFLARRWQDEDSAAEQDRLEDMALIAALREMSYDAFMVKAQRIKHVFDDEILFEKWRATLDTSTGQRIYVKTKLQDHMKSLVNRTMQDLMMITTAKDSALSAEEKAQRIAQLQAQRDELRSVLVLFNKMDIGVGRNRTYYRQIAVKDSQREILKDAVDMFVAQFGRWQTLHEAALRRDMASGAIRAALGRRKVALAIALEADAHTDRFGLSSFSPRRGSGWVTGFGAIMQTLAQEGGYQNHYVDALTGELPPAHFFREPASGTYYFHVANRTPAFALKSAFADAGRLFGPADRFDALDPDVVERLQASMRRFIHDLLANADVLRSENLGQPSPWGQSWSTLLRTYNLEQFTGKPIPTNPIENSLIAMHESRSNVPQIMMQGDVINCYMAMSDETANAYVYGIGEPRQLAPIAYQMDEDFREVLYTIDKGRVQSSRQMSSSVSRSMRTTIPMFACREFVFMERHDPTLLSYRPISLQTVWPKLASGQSDPEKFGAHGIHTLSPAPVHDATGPFGIYLYRRRSEMEQDRLMLITSDKRCVLGATPDNPQGDGFANQQELGPDWGRRASGDMALLNKSRNAGLQGVVNQLLDEFLARGDQLNQEAEAARAMQDHNGYLRKLHEALGSEVKAYRELQQMNADMLKAVIVYMALMLPFCFFLQKLMFNFKRMEHELAGFAGLFALMFIIFRFIHPAFRLAMSPEAIFIAFVLGAIGVFTTWVLRSRFNEEMKILFRGVGGIGEEVGYGTVGTTAMLIGVQNMRRRRVRTTLTTITIVLVVFTMLAFSSVSRKAKPTLLPKGDTAPYTGFFYHWPKGDPMDEASYRTLNNLFADRARVRVRRLLQNRPSLRAPAFSWRLETGLPSGTYLDIKALTGLPPDDTALRDAMALVEGEMFSSNNAPEIFLSVLAADALGLGSADVGQVTLRLMGREWLLKGLFDDQRYRLARDLDPNLPLLPFGSVERQVTADDGNLDANIPDLDEQLLDPASLVIVPEGVAAELGAPPRSVSIVFDTVADDTRLGREIARALTASDAKFFVGSREPFRIDEEASVAAKPGTYYVGSSYRTAIGGLAKLLIPLIIAGSIILNTMLGTVYERKSEIAVFNAIGLNPTHIFTFFLAEAVVYSIIGAVGGYMIGQVLTIGFKAAGMIQDVNINFSSLIVVYAILFTMALVILSTIYPGYVATRTAVPSGKRKWTMPPHDGQRMDVVFPFIYRPKLAYGVMSYLEKYFAPMCDQSIGDMLAKLETVQSGADAAGHSVLTLRYDIALAPYDLGVTQQVTFTTRYDEIVKSFRLHMGIERVSGTDTNWVTTNKPFLERMRKHLIRWRNIDPTQQAGYVRNATAMFTQGQPPVVDGDAKE